MLQAFGATVIYTDPLEGSDGAIREAHRRYAADPEKYFMPDQYNNPANWLAHYDTTGPEIIRQTHGRITHFVAGVGTSGTLMGTGRRLREFKPDIQLVAVMPAEELHGIEGLKHMETAINPGIWDAHFPDRTITVFTEDAYAVARRLARDEGILAGQSSGAAIYAALQLARQLTEGVIVTVLPDAGDRYFSTGLWEV
jgi:cysteine synthase B